MLRPRSGGDLAEEHPPVLRTHDRYGNRIDEVRYDPAYHQLMSTAVELGLHGAPWVDPNPHAHLVRAAKMAVWGQTDAGHGCPISMTYAVIPVAAAQHGSGRAVRTPPDHAALRFGAESSPHQTRIDRRYVDDGEAGRFGRSCRNHKGSATIRRQLPLDGPQVVHLRADVRTCSSSSPRHLVACRVSSCRGSCRTARSTTCTCSV